MLTARQAAEQDPGRITVIPARSVAAGLAAAIAFVPDDDRAALASRVTEAAGAVRSVEVTRAVRDTTADGGAVREGDAIVFVDGRLIAQAATPEEALLAGLAIAVDEGRELVSVYLGADRAHQRGRAASRAHRGRASGRRGRGGAGRAAALPLSSRRRIGSLAYAHGRTTMTVRIVTDSTADLDPKLAAEHDITVVPLSVLFGDEELLDGVDIDSKAFFERLEREPALPTTSQSSAGAFREVYQRLAEEGATEILSIHVSEKLSGTLDSARQGAQGVEDVRIEFLDSQLTTLALALGVLTAAKAIAGGASLDEARDAAASQFARTETYFLVDTLEYLRRGGRIGRASEVLGSLLRVKPLLALRNGEVEPIGRVRTKQKAIDDLMRRAAALRPIEQMMVAHAAAPDDLAQLVERLRALAPDAPLVTGEVGPGDWSARGSRPARVRGRDAR